MNVPSSPELAPAPALNEAITNAANLHKGTVMGSFGKVSATTGWKAFFRGEIFGHGTKTGLTGLSLFNSIASTHGKTIATRVIQQLQLSQTDNTRPINSYNVAKAVALVESQSDWTKVHTTKIQYTRVDEQGKPTGDPVEHTTTLTPFGRLQSFKGSNDVFGVSSGDVHNENVVNGWVDQMHDAQGTLVSHNIRTGVTVPPKVKAKDGVTETAEAKKKRMDIAMTRYKQTLSAMAETTPGFIDSNLNYEENSESHPLEIEPGDIGMLSPNKPEELAMAKDQMEFLKDKVNGQTFQIDYAKKNEDGTITMTRPWVRPKVHYTNFSVQKAQREGAPQPEEGSPDHETEQTLDHYLGKEADEYGELQNKIAKLPPEKQDAAWKSLIELKNLRPNKSKEGSSFYSYEFQTKYALLLNKCGIPTHVYCKSGKDRTSRFCEMSKMWAANIGLKLSKMTRAVRNIIKAFSFSGNKTVQRLCTGFAGNKQFKTYWRLIAGEKKDRTFGGWTHWLSAASYAPWWSVKT